MDYIFYRIYNFYAKKDNIPFTTSIGFLVTIYALVIVLFGVLFNLISGDLFTAKFLRKELIKFSWIAILLLITILNIYRYKKIVPIDLLVGRYKNSSLNNKLRIWQIFILPVLIFLITISILLLFKSFK